MEPEIGIFSGRFGAGTKNPKTLIHVLGTDTENNSLYVSSEDIDKRLAFKHQGTTGEIFSRNYSTSVNNDLLLNKNLLIKDSGRVKIGDVTNNPVEALEISGALRLTGASATQMDGTIIYNTIGSTTDFFGRKQGEWVPLTSINKVKAGGGLVLDDDGFSISNIDPLLIGHGSVDKETFFYLTNVNKDIQLQFDDITKQLVFDNTPTENSNNLVRSGAVFSFLAGKQDKFTPESRLDARALGDGGITNRTLSYLINVESDIQVQINNIANYDTIPKANSLQGVTSKGIFEALALKAEAFTQDNRLEAIAIGDGTVTNTAFGYLSNVKSDIQQQIDAIPGASAADNFPTNGSENFVKSSGIHTRLSEKHPLLTVTNTLDPTLIGDGSVSTTTFGYLANVNKDIQFQLDNVTDNIVYDNTPIQNSQNPLTSGSLFVELGKKQDTITTSNLLDASLIGDGTIHNQTLGYIRNLKGDIEDRFSEITTIAQDKTPITTYIVTVEGNPKKFYIDGVEAPQLTFIPGSTYRFNVASVTTANYRFYVTTTSGGGGGLVGVTNGITNNGIDFNSTNTMLTYKVPHYPTGKIYYASIDQTNMGNRINVIDQALQKTDNVTFNDMTISGNLIVSGNQTIVNTSTITVEDPVITIGSNTTDDNLDRGVEFKYNDGSAKVGFMGWDDSASRFVLLKDATNTNEVFTGTDADLQAAKGLFSGDIVVGGNKFQVSSTNGTTSVGGQLFVTGNSSISGTLTMDSNKITNVTDPTDAQDASTKAYVDSKTQNIPTGATLTLPKINDSNSSHKYEFAVSDLTADRTMTLPLLTGNDEFVFKDHTQTLTNKTLTSPVVTGGTINNTPIGGTTPNTGSFTTINASSNVTIGGSQTTTGLTNSNGGIAVDTDKFTVATNGNTITKGTLTVSGTGATTLGGTLDVTGLTTTAGITASGLLNANAGIAVDTDKFTVADTSGNVSTKGTLSVESTTTLTGDVTVSNLKLNADDAANKTMTVDATNSHATGEGKLVLSASDEVVVTDGTATVKIDGGVLSTVTSSVDLDSSGAVSINSSGGVINIGNDNVNQGINIATSGTRNVVLGTTTTNLDINSAGATIDSTTLAINSTNTTGITMTANDASTKKITIQAKNSTANHVGEINMIADGDVSIVPGSSDGTTGSLKVLKVDSTAAIRVPVGTTAQRNIASNETDAALKAAAKGSIRYNTNTLTFEGYNGGTWGSLGGVKDVDQDTLITSESTPGADEDTLTFQTGGTKRATMDASGNFDVYDSTGTNSKFKVTNAGNTTIGGTLGVSSTSTMTGLLNANGGIAVNTDKFTVAANGNTTTDGTLSSKGDFKVNTNKFVVIGTSGNTTVAGTMDITGDTGIDGDFDIATNKFTVASGTGNTTVAGTLDVTGNTSIDGDFDIATNKFTVASGTGNTAVAGTLDVTGLTTTAGITASGLLNANAGIAVDTNKFTVADGTGNTSINGTLSVNSTVGISGDTTLNDANLIIKNSSAADKFKVLAASGNTDIKGTLDTAGDFKVASNKFTVASGTGNTTVAGTLDVTGNTGIDGDFDIATDKFTVASGTGNTTVAGTLGVTGLTTTAGITASGLLNANGGIATDTDKFTVATNGNTVTKGTLTVSGTGATTLGGDLSVGGTNFQVVATSGNTSIAGTLTSDGNVTVENATLKVRDGSSNDKFTVAANGNTTVGGTLGVTGVSTMTGLTNANGGIAVDTDKFTVAANGNTVTKGTLTVSGTGATELGGSLTVTGTSTFNDNVSISGNKTLTVGTGLTTLGGNLQVDGNLTISGTTTTVNTSTITVEDPVITVGTNASDDNKDRGVEIKWHDGTGSKIGFFGMDDSTGEFTFIQDATNTNEVFSGTAGNAKFTNMSLGGTLGVTGTSTLSGLLNANGGIAVDTNKFTVADGSGNTAIAGTLNVTGNTTVSTISTSGQIDMNSNKIVNVTDPTGAQDVATKKYVDDQTTAIPANALLTTPRINDTSSNNYYQFSPSELTANRTVTLPLLTGDDEFVFKDHTQTLTNKTLTNPDINGGTIDSATIATSDITVGAGKTLNVSAGTLTLADNQISGDKVEGGTIAGITITTLGSTTVNSTTVDTTNIEVTNIKAKDGTAAATIADSTGVVTIPSSVLTTTDINGGTIDNATIATSDITVGTGKTLNVSAGTLTLADNQISGDKVEGGTIAGITITTLGSTTVNSTTVDTTNVEVTNIKAKDGTSAATVADSTGVVTIPSSVLTTTDINGGTIDNATIGANTPAAITGTTITANTNFVGNVTGTVSSIANHDTSDLSEGTNLYHTTARARASVSVTDSGGDGSLAYNSTSGVITYTGPSAAETRAHFSAGTGVGISAGEISIGQPVGTTDNVTFGNIAGTLTTAAQANITTMTGLVSVGSTGNTTTFSGPILADEGLKVDTISEDTTGSGVTIDGVVLKDNSITASGGVTADLTGNAATATKLETARTIAGQSFDGSANITIASTDLSDASTFTAPKSTILATARTIGGVSFNGSSNIDLPGVNTSGNQDTSGNAATATVLATARTIAGQSFDGSANITIASTDLSDASTFTAPKSTILATARTIGGVSFNGSSNIDLPGVNTSGNQDTSGNAATATVLATARTIGGVSFDGSSNINLPGVNASGNQDTSGNAATATKLAATKNIGGVAFDGSANINLPGVNASGNQDTSGNAATATALATARTIGGVSFDGSANINLPGVNASGNQDTSGNAATATKLAASKTIGGVAFDGSANINLPGVNASGNQDTSGNAATATVLATARTIGGVSFDGSANINLPGVNTTGNQDTSGNAATATTAGTVTTAAQGNITSVGTLTGLTVNGSVSANTITINNAATNTNHAVTKGYVDSVASGLDVKKSVRVATTTNGTLASSFANGQTVDGITLATGDRILIKNQTTGSENGIYTVNASGAPTRATDFDDNTEVTSGAFTFVEQGTVNADNGFALTTDGSITVGTTALVFTQFTGAGSITAGAGLSQTGNTINVNVDDSSLEVSSDTMRVKSGGVTNTMLANNTVSFGGVSLALGGTDATPAFDLSDATNYPTSSLTGTITNAQLAGSIANDKLANNTVSFGGVSLALGATDATPAFNLSDATGYPTSSLTGTITNAQLSGSIANDKLANNTVSFGGVSLALGATDATPAFDLSDATNYPTSSLSGTITNTQLAGSITNSKLANSGKLNDSTNVFYSEATVTANGGKFYVDGTQQQELHLQKGMTYRFNQSDSSNNSHPFYFSTTSNGTHNSGSKYTTGVTEVGTPGSSGSYTQIIVQQDTPTLYYYCGNHSGMGGKAVIDIQEKLTTGSVTNDMLAGTIPIAKGGTGATSAAAARTALGVDAAGTDNSTNVTLATVSGNYLTLSGQAITAGTVPVSLGGTGATSAAAARTALGVDAAGTDNSTNVTLATVSGNYLTLSGQAITAGTVPVSLGGTGATSAAAARTALGAINGLTVKQDSTTNSNDATYTTITTLIFDYDAGLQVSNPSTGEAKITLGSHWKTIQIDGTNAVTPSGEETLNLIKGTGINITGNSGSTPQSLTFSINAALNDLSNVSAGSPSTNDLLKWNGSAWVPGTVSGGATSLNGLSDVLVENNSVFLGSDPSSSTDTAEKNVAVGIGALDSITTGDGNVAVGYNSMSSNTTASFNVAIGRETLLNSSNKDYLVAIGFQSMQNASGNLNTAIGYQTLPNTTGHYNTVVGYQAGNDITSGNHNTLLGMSSGDKITTGTSNVIIGSNAGGTLTTGGNNVLIGKSAEVSANDSSNAIVIGNGSTGHGSNIVVIGNSSITAWHPGDDNGVDLGSTSYSFKDAHIQGVIYASTLNNGTSFTLPTADGTNGQFLKTNGSGTLSWGDASSGGASSLNGLSDVLIENNSIFLGSDPSSTTNNAEYNVSLGINALDSITTGDNNVAVGYNSLTANTEGSENVSIGYDSLKDNTTGEYNISLGSEALTKNTTGGDNIAIGYRVLKENTTSNGNIGIGKQALVENTTGSNNVSIGKSSMLSNTTGNGNVSLGRSSLESNTTGGYNTVIGAYAGDTLTTGNYNVLIGNDADTTSNNVENVIVIGNEARDHGSNIAVIGNSSITAWHPGDDNGVDLGSASYSFKDAHIQGVIHATQIKTGTPTFTLPTADGSSGQFLKTDGNGTLSWGTASGGGSGSFTGLSDTPSSFSGQGGKFLKVNSTPNAVEFASFSLSDIPSGGASTGQVLKWSGSAWAPGTDNTGSGGGGGGGGSSTGTLGVYNATGDAKVMIETDGTNASDVAKLVLQKGTAVANLSWNGTTLEVDKPFKLSSTLSLGSTLTASSANSDVLLVGSGTDFQVKKTSVALSSLLTTSSSVTNLGTLSSLTVSGDATFDTSTLKVDSTNNRVGIGTTSPNFRMSFGDGTTNTEWSNGKGILAIHETSGNYFYGLGLGSHDSVNNGGLCLWGGTEGNAPSNSNCHLFIKRNSGNVGIGTTNPVSSLHVKDSLAIFTLETTSGDVNGSYSYISFKDSVGEKAWIGDGSGGDKAFYVHASRGQNIALTGGNVGIGDTTPSYKLDVNGTGRFTGDLTAGANLTVTGNLTINGTTTTVSTTNMVVSDSLIELNSGASSNANDCGIVIERGSTGDNAFMGWDESADKFLMGTTTATGASTGNLSVTTGTLVANLEGNVTGNATTVTNGVYTTSSVTALSDVSSVGSGSIITSSERTKLSGIATGANNYSLPTASASALGGVKVGSGLSISSGVLSATSSGKWSGSTDIYYTSGKVGIGTTSPGAPLEIHGGAGSGDEVLILSNSKDSSTTGLHAIFLDGGHHYDVYNSSTIQTGKSTSNGSNYHMNRYSAGDVTMVAGGGNVGIGTTSPGEKLDVSGNINASGSGSFRGGSINTSTVVGVHLGAHSSGSSKYGNIQIVTNNNDGGWIDFIKSDSGDSDARGRIRYGTGSGGLNGMQFMTETTERMRITTTGNVGIGTNNPSEKLHISEGKLLIIDNPNSSGAGDGRILGGHSDNAHAIHFRVGEDGTTDVLDFHEYGKIRFYTNGALSSQTEKMCILSNGNVGIGTDSPSAPLEIKCTAGTNTHNEQWTGAKGLRLARSSDAYAWEMVNGRQNDLLFRNIKSDGTVYTDNVLMLDDNGKVGIGTNSPSYKLDVAGDINLTGDISISGTDLGLNHLSDASVSGTEITLGISTTTAILPSPNGTVDLGSSSKKFDVLYASKLNNGVSFTLPTADGTSGQFLKTDGSGTLSWGTASGGGGGASALNDLSDVSTSGAQTNYALVYNGSSWAPAAQSGSGGSSTSSYYSAHIQNISDITRYTGYTVSTSTTYSDAYPAEFAFSHLGNKNEGQAIWVSANNTYSSGSYTGSVSTNSYNGEWIQINFGKKVKVYSYAITGQNGVWNVRSPGGYKLFASNDGSSWTDVHTGSATSSDYSEDYNKTKNNTLSTPVTYQYFRLVINSTSGSTVLTAIAYLGFHGTFVEPDLIKGAISANVVHQRMTETASLSVAANGGKTEIEGLRLTITPQSSSSKLELNYSIFNQFSNHNAGFVVSRTVGGTETLLTSNHITGSYPYDLTFIHSSSMSDYTTQPMTTSHSMIDEPNTTDTVVYKVYGRTSGHNAITLYINRTGSDSGEGNYEHGISTSSVKEFSTFTHNIEEQKVQGRVLETLEGVCDGRSVTVSSGTYTLDNVTTYQSLTKAITTATGSTINYKPPSGTKQVIYEFYFSSCSDNLDDHSIQAYLEIDGTKCTNQQRMIGSWNAYTSTSVFKIVFDIGNVSSDDLANAKLANWDTLKQLRIKVRSHIDSNTQGRLHTVNQWTTGEQTGSNSSNGRVNITSSNISSYLYKPTLKITAIGEENLVYNLTNQYSITEGQTLETLAGVCDGRSVSVSSGTYTLPNITSTLALTTTFTDIGTSFSYKPPSGTRQIIYTMKIHTQGQDAHSISYYRLFVDNTEVTAFRQGHNGIHNDELMILTWTFTVADVDDVANGRFVSWDSNKTIMIKGAHIGSSNAMKIFGTVYEDGSTTYQFVAPILEIQAIGKGVIEGTIGNLYSSKVNMVNIKMEEQLGISITGGTKVEIQQFRMTIVPVHADSKFEINYSIFNEWGTYNAGYVVSRTVNGTETLFTPGGNDGVNDMTFGVPYYESDYATTPNSTTFSMIDEPGTTDAIVYKLYGKTTALTRTLHINRTGTNSNTDEGHEDGISFCSVKELPQQTTLHNPRYNSVIEQEGQVLETVAGVCDGRSVTVSSGTYTLENITTGTKIDETTPNFIDFPGSSITYKPPPGTRQVYYSFKFSLGRYDSHNSMGYKFFIGGTEVTSFKRYDGMNGNYGEGFLSFDCVIEIGNVSTDDIPNGKLSSWNTLKTLKVQVAQEDNYGFWLNKSYYDIQQGIASNNASSTETTYVRKPSLKVEAIGRKSDTTFLNSFFNERKGQVLETLSGTCDGRTITVDSGTYTLANIETGTSIDGTTYVDFPGSSIAYKPPAGTKQVIYKFNSVYGRKSSNTSVGFSFFIDNTEVTTFREYFGAAGDYANNVNQSYVINIDGTDDIPNGRLSSWDALKTLKIKVASQSGYGIYINKRRYEIRDGVSGSHSSTTLTDYVYKPNLEIQAIGDAAIQNATVVAGHSMVHFQGYSDTVTTTDSIRYISGYEDAPTSGNFTTGLPVLKNFGNAMNTSTGIFTTPHTGLYSINVVVHKHNETNSGRVTLVIDDKETSFGDSLDYYDNSGVSSVYHIDSGKQVYLKSPSSNTFPTAVNLSITALQDQVPQAISARPGMVLETLSGHADGSTVTVSSGTYTMGTLGYTVGSTISTSYVKETASEMTYKTPFGTERITFQFDGFYEYDSGGALLEGEFYVDDVKYSGSGSRGHFKYRGGQNPIGKISFPVMVITSQEYDLTVSHKYYWKIKSYSSSHKVHYGYGNSTDYDNNLPFLKIQAIGDGPGIVPSTGMNVVKVSTGTTATYTPPKSSPGVEIEHLRISIKPTATDSIISLNWKVFCDGYRNIGFRVTRNITGTDVLVYDDSKGYTGSFIAMVTHDETGTNSNQTSPQVVPISWNDEPNTTSTVTYKLWIGNSHNTGEGFTLNKFMRTVDLDGREYGVSTGIAIEYPKTARPLDTENALTIPPFVGATNKEKLYNQSGDLYFNGKQLSNEWYKNGGDLYRLGANVGIGKSSPAYKLDVLGDINFTNSLRKNGTALGEWNASGSDIYRSTGNVGFGTSTFVDTTRNPNGIHIASDNGISFLANTGQTDSRNWRIRHDDLAAWGSLQFTVSSNNSSAPTESSNAVMTMLRSGYVGIGSTSPNCPLYIEGSASLTFTRKSQLSSGGVSTYSGLTQTFNITLNCRGYSLFQSAIFNESDSRIKKNIEDVPDNLALQQVRNIPCRYYEYKDTFEKGEGKTIGFIAQEVKSVLPMAVTMNTQIIPNVYKIISCEWSGNVMYSQELGTVSGVKYKFYVGEEQKPKTITGSSDNTFTFEQQWTNVFCYGHEVEDFHILDKNKLFALNFSATQELDRQQQADKAKITSLETEVASLKTTLASQQTLIQSLMTRLEALENP